MQHFLGKDLQEKTESYFSSQKKSSRVKYVSNKILFFVTETLKRLFIFIFSFPILVEKSSYHVHKWGMTSTPYKLYNNLAILC